MVRAFFRNNKSYFSLQSLLLLLGIYPLCCDQVVLSRWVNNHHHTLLDALLPYVAWLGSSLMYILLMLALLLMGYSIRKLLIGVGSFGLMSAVIQGLKRISWFNQVRPIALLAGDEGIHQIAEMPYQIDGSFPSGHAGAIFTMICLWQFIMTRKSLGTTYMLLFVACAVAYSRVYFLHHFYIDVYVGALLGVLITVLVHCILVHWKGPAWLDDSPWRWLMKKQTN